MNRLMDSIAEYSSEIKNLLQDLNGNAPEELVILTLTK